MNTYNVIKGIKESFAEKKVREYLEQHEVVFEQEVEFDNCINPLSKHHLRFDFYLPVQNVLIEYDGIDFHEASDTRFRDSIKNRFAKQNGIKLLRLQGIQNIHLLGKILKLKKKVAIDVPKEKEGLKTSVNAPKINPDYRNGKRLNRGNKFKRK